MKELLISGDDLAKKAATAGKMSLVQSNAMKEAAKDRQLTLKAVSKELSDKQLECKSLS